MTVVKSNFARKENDLYETDAWAFHALRRAVPEMFMTGLPIWEPSAGNHKLADAMKDAGLQVVTSDVHTYSKKHDFKKDFFQKERVTGEPSESVICTNPPFGTQNRVAVKYAELSLKRAEWVALLLTAKFDFGSTRQHLFKNNPDFFAKVSLMDRIQWFDPAPGERPMKGTEDHAWYVWKKGNLQSPFILWERNESNIKARIKNNEQVKSPGSF